MKSADRRHLYTVSLTLIAATQVLSQSLPPSRSAVANDVSRLNPISVQQVYEIHDVEQLREALRDAAKSHLKVSIAGKRHSQGGQTAYPHGISMLAKLPEEDSGEVWGAALPEKEEVAA